ncbi:hypothetical protein HNV12_02080 [Methanococcoides sp. SA1]|nr:hypothetical protein [Methanococcoides sp. SA1]
MRYLENKKWFVLIGLFIVIFSSLFHELLYPIFGTKISFYFNLITRSLGVLITFMVLFFVLRFKKYSGKIYAVIGALIIFLVEIISLLFSLYHSMEKYLGLLAILILIGTFLLLKGFKGVVK